MKALTYVAGAALAAIVTMAATPSHALTIANGSFGFVPVGALSVNTTDITALTASKLYPGTQTINTIDAVFLGNPNNLGVALSSAIGVNPLTLPFAPGTGTTIGLAPNVTITTANGLTFTFTTEETLNRIPTTATVPGGPGNAGFIAEQLVGTLTGAPAGTFELGTPAIIAQNCNQSAIGGAINCSDTLSVASTLTTVPEPASLALLQYCSL
jgi:hypothetical protein